MLGPGAAQPRRSGTGPLAPSAGVRWPQAWDDADVSEGTEGVSSAVDGGRVGAGFEAMAAGDWRGARDAFSAVLEVAAVPEALLGLANALFWLGDIAGTIANCEKA